MVEIRQLSKNEQTEINFDQQHTSVAQRCSEKNGGYRIINLSGSLIAGFMWFDNKSKRSPVEKEQTLLIGPNETFGGAVLRIDKHDVLWIAAWRVD